MEPTTTEGPPASSSSWKREFLSRTFGVLVLLAFWFVPIWDPSSRGLIFTPTRVTWRSALSSQWTRLTRSVNTEGHAMVRGEDFDTMESFSARAWTACVTAIPIAALALVVAPRTRAPWLTRIAAPLGAGAASSCLLFLELDGLAISKEAHTFASLAPIVPAGIAGFGIVAMRPWAPTAAWIVVALTWPLCLGLVGLLQVLWGAPLVAILFAFALVPEAGAVPPESEGAPGSDPDAP